jgi:N-ethylmaleimide reductase
MKSTPISKLLAPAQVGTLNLHNAMVMAPMTRSRAINGIPNELMAGYYAQRASAGLIITEGNAPSANGLGYARTPGIYNDQQIAGWKSVTDAVHRKGGKIVIQLMHVGRIAHAANQPQGARILAPSAVPANGDMWTDTSGMQKLPLPEAMTQKEIKETIGEFVAAAKNAIAAGFDGVEVHGANGYLVEQFLNPHSNLRTDAYGGSVINRNRFVLELMQALVEAIGSNKTALRISPFATYNDMPAYSDTAEIYSYLSQQLDKLGILYLHVVEASARASEAGRALINSIRHNFSGTLILNGGFDLGLAQDALLNGRADLIAFGVPFLSNPDLPYRFEHQLPLNTPDPATFYAATEKGYTDYVFAVVQA